MSRRSHQCHRAGCDSEAEWKLFVRFTTRTPGGSIIPCVGESTIIVCDRHRRFAAERFVSKPNMDVFAAGLEREHLAVPHPASIEIEFGRLPKADGVIDVKAVKEHFGRA